MNFYITGLLHKTIIKRWKIAESSQHVTQPIIISQVELYSQGKSEVGENSTQGARSYQQKWTI